MEKKIVITAAIFGLSAIILGAFGSHKLKELLQPEQLNSFEIGVRYQMYHALFLLFVVSNNWLTLKEKHYFLFSISWCFIVFRVDIFTQYNFDYRDYN